MAMNALLLLWLVGLSIINVWRVVIVEHLENHNYNNLKWKYLLIL